MKAFGDPRAERRGLSKGEVIKVKLREHMTMVAKHWTLIMAKTLRE
jgi:hypothetical protein